MRLRTRHAIRHRDRLYQIASASSAGLRARNYLVCGRPDRSAGRSRPAPAPSSPTPPRRWSASSATIPSSSSSRARGGGAVPHPLRHDPAQQRLSRLIRQASAPTRWTTRGAARLRQRNAPEIGEYGSITSRPPRPSAAAPLRVFAPEKIAGAIAWARRESAAQRLRSSRNHQPSRVTDIAMGAG